MNRKASLLTLGTLWTLVTSSASAQGTPSSVVELYQGRIWVDDAFLTDPQVDRLLAISDHVAFGPCSGQKVNKSAGCAALPLDDGMLALDPQLTEILSKVKSFWGAEAELGLGASALHFIKIPGGSKGVELHDDHGVVDGEIMQADATSTLFLHDVDPALGSEVVFPYANVSANSRRGRLAAWSSVNEKGKRDGLTEHGITRYSATAHDRVVVNFFFKRQPSHVARQMTTISAREGAPAAHKWRQLSGSSVKGLFTGGLLLPNSQPYVRPDSAVDFCEQLVDGVQEGQPACLRTEPEKYADADKYFKHPFRKCSYKSGGSINAARKALDTIATDGEACSRMIQTKYPEAEGAFFGATEITTPPEGGFGREPAERQTTPAGYCAAIISVDLGASYSYSYQAHEEAGNDGRYSWCLFGEKWGGRHPFKDEADEEASHWAQPASASEPGTLVNVCRPAALPKSLDRSQIKSAAMLETELKVIDRAPCPGDARLVIAHLAPDSARDPRGLTRAICACDHYVGASSVPPAGERMCAKDMLDPTAAGGRFGHLDHTPVMCYPTGANFPAVGKDDGGALAWHGCRSDQRPCTIPLTCTWTPGVPRDFFGYDGPRAGTIEPVGKAPSAQACSAMVQKKAPWANGAAYHVLLSSLPFEDRHPEEPSPLPPFVYVPGLCWATYLATETYEVRLTADKTYETCKFDGWQAPDGAMMPMIPPPCFWCN